MQLIVALPDVLVSMIVGDWLATDDKAIGKLLIAVPKQDYVENMQTLRIALTQSFVPSTKMPRATLTFEAFKKYCAWIESIGKKLQNLICSGPEHSQYLVALTGRSGYSVMERSRRIFSFDRNYVVNMVLQITPNLLVHALLQFPRLTSLTLINDNAAITERNFRVIFPHLTHLSEFTMIVHKPECSLDFLELYMPATSSIRSFIEHSTKFRGKLSFILFEPRQHQFRKARKAYFKLADEEPFKSLRSTTIATNDDGSVTVESTFLV